jgi:hypothetical protein
MSLYVGSVLSAANASEADANAGGSTSIRARHGAGEQTRLDVTHVSLGWRPLVSMVVNRAGRFTCTGDRTAALCFNLVMAQFNRSQTASKIAW